MRGYKLLQRGPSMALGQPLQEVTGTARVDMLSFCN